jgi:predicted metal-binding membrane protein
MASLFALGVMSLVWMAVVAGVIALEKLVPWRRVAVYGTAVVLAVLGTLLLATPGALPGLTIPGTGSMPGMSHMSKMETPPAGKMPASKPMPMSEQMPSSKPMPSAFEPDLGDSQMGP